jgi:homoserine O-acetyltransferase
MNETSSVGIVETQYFTFAEAPNEMVLESGAKLGPITLAYETYGALNAEASNAILLEHALSGDAHVAGKHCLEDRKPGWWDAMVGPGKAFDTNEYFVICSNVLGGCTGSTGPSSINPATGRSYGMDFPFVTLGDMVRAQRELVKHLGIERLLAVAGGSMGGMQTLEWAVRYPDEVRATLVIAASAQNGPQQIAFHAVGRHAIQADTNFQGGEYYEDEQPAHGLAIARMLSHITYLSDASMRKKFGRRLQDSDELRFDVGKEFSVESYLDYQGEAFVHRFDANSYLYITKAIDYFDLARDCGSLDAAMARVKAEVLVVSFTSDWLYPPDQSEKIVYSLARQRKNVTYCNLHSNYGHDAFLLEVDTLTQVVDGILKHLTYPDRACDRCEEDKRKPRAIEPPVAAHASIYTARRVDYDMIVDLIAEGSRVLDVGCGGGELLCMLGRRKNVGGLGIELDEDNIVSAITCGVPVIQADIDRGLSGLPDASFDYVVLSMTLQVIQKPDIVMKEMLRVGKKCIVSFPNFAYYRVRFKALIEGRAPVTRNLPYSWYHSPNRHVLSIKDFRAFCSDLNIHIEKEFPLTSEGTARLWPNLLAEEALYVLSNE